MKNTKFILLLLFCLVAIGIVLIPYTQFKRENLKEYKQLKANGQSLVSLLSLSSTAHLMPGSNDPLLRELSQNSLNKTIAYCIIHNAEKKLVVLFSPDNIHVQVPEIIKNNSIFKNGFIMQEFSTKNNLGLIEFARPVFKNGEVLSVVRVGLKVSDRSFFTYSNIVLPSQISFFILLTLVIGYYWFIISLKYLNRFKVADDYALEPTGKSDHFKDIMLNLETNMVGMQKKINGTESDWQELESSLKISQFENKQLFNVFNSFDFGIMLIDSRDTIYFINTYFSGILEKSNDDVIDNTFNTVIEHQDLNSFIQQRDGVEGHRFSSCMEMKFEKIDPYKVYRAHSFNIMDAEGVAVGKAIMMENISKEKEAQKSQQDFIDHIAHELRTPLTNIKAYNEMMMDGEIENAEMQKEFFNTINDETNRLAKLIAGILELAEAESGQFTTQKDMVKTDWLLEGCIEAVEAVATEKNITIERQVPDNFPKLSGYKEMLKSALINILGNAVKYSPKNGTISFAIKEMDETVVFEINDTGFGIDDKDLPHIFEKFYRAENDQVLSETGSGLGLSITSKSIELHGGSIEVQSELGKGSQFKITIPKGDLHIG